MAKRKGKPPEQTRVEVAIVVALDEEYNVFSKHSFFTITAQVTRDGVGLAFFDYKDAAGHLRSGVFIRVSGMAEQARDAVFKSQTYIDASFWISTGISGALSSDVHPGDIILSDVVFNPLELAKAQTSGSGYELAMGGGRPAVGNVDIKQVAQRWADNAEALRIFARDAHDRLEQHVSKLPGEEGLALSRALAPLLDRRPQLYVGPIAAGNVLSAAKEFKEELLGTNRKLLAYDMETCEVGGALSSLGLVERFLAVRTVSDYGDSNKNAFEAATRGVVRVWALRGLTDFLVFTLRSGLSYAKVAQRSARHNNNTVRETSSAVRPPAVLTHVGARIEPNPLSELWDARYSALIGDDAYPATSAPVMEIASDFAAARAGERVTIVICGPAGSGKSALLNLLKARWLGRDPIVLSAADTRAWNGDPEELLDIAVRNYVSHLAIDQGEPPLVLVDDIDCDIESNRLLVQQLCHVAERTNGCCIVFAAISTDPNLDHFPESVVANRWIPLRSVLPGTTVFDGFLASFEPFFPPSVTLAQLRARVAELDPKSIDPQFISVLLENLGNARFKDVKNAAQFALFTARLLGASANVTLPPNFIEECAADAFARYSGEEPTPFPAAAAAAYLKVRRTGEWVQEALVAEFAVNAIRRVAKGMPLRHLERSALERVYDIRVSGLVKHIIQGSESRVIFTGVEKLLYECDVAITPFLVYILGRIDDQSYQRRAQHLLKELSDAGKTDFEGWKNAHKSNRLVSLARRAVYISRAYQGEREAAESYVALLAKDPAENLLNRGFHLEYYRDLVVRPKAGLAGFMLSDDSPRPWQRAYEVLSRNILKDLNSGPLSAKGIVELGTFCSFVADRLDQGALDGNLRSSIKSLLAIAVSRGKVSPVLNGICNAILYELDQPPRTGTFALFETVYRLKQEERVGWRRRHIAERLGKPAETVASHIFGACLLALWLLPDRAEEGEPPYSKARIIKLLMIHDIGESVIGDLAPDEKGANPNAEAEAVARIAGMAMMPALNNLQGLYEDWQDFEDATSNEAKIARDIDYLEALIQAAQYRPYFENQENYEEFVEYHRTRIRTRPGAKILEAILRGADLSSAAQE